MGRKLLIALAATSLVLTGQSAASADTPFIQPDPLLSWGATQVDRVKVAQTREARAKARTVKTSTAAPINYTEREAVGTRGANDTLAKAERIAAFGSHKKAVVTGDLAPDLTVPTLPAFAETNDAITLAADPGITPQRPSARTSGVIGDGPHGSAGDKTGDFDYYKLVGGTTDTRVTVTTATPTGGLDTALLLWDDLGELWDVGDNVIGSTDSRLVVNLPAGQTRYVMVGSAGPNMFPRNPKTPGTGAGVGTEGPYELKFAGAAKGDFDYFAVDLKAGDVLGASVNDGGVRVAVYDPAGREVAGSDGDPSFIFAIDSPLPGGGNAGLDFVAPRDGRYVVGVEAGEGRYTAQIEAFRPASETAPRGTVQTLFLDFDGARVNTRIYDPVAGGSRDLSPAKAFLAGWGLTERDEKALIDVVTATVRENMDRDIATKGTNPRHAIRILNSRDHADPWGQPNVSRVVVGGSIEESRIPTVGIAESIDAGNFGKEETALVLLDLLSSPTGSSISINTYLKPQSDKIAFIGRAIGNIVAHEAGHMAGNWHQDLTNDVVGIMDPGGNPAAMFGVGPDNVGGTADDPDVDFVEDRFSPFEGFTGLEDTINRTAWGYTRGKG